MSDLNTAAIRTFMETQNRCSEDGLRTRPEGDEWLWTPEDHSCHLHDKTMLQACEHIRALLAEVDRLAQERDEARAELAKLSSPEALRERRMAYTQELSEHKLRKKAERERDLLLELLRSYGRRVDEVGDVVRTILAEFERRKGE